MAATFLQLCLVIGVSVLVYGTEDVCNCSQSGSVMDCSYRNCRQPPAAYPEDVKVLKMSGNGITEIAKNYFINCAHTNFEEVYLDNNNISRVHYYGFQGLGEATIIDLSYNSISSLQVDKGQVKKCSNLSLSGNPLKAVKFPDDLKSLNLSSCQLESGNSVMNSVKELEKLRSLDLSSNKLTDWGEILDLVSLMTRLESLHLTGNPWKCDCSVDYNRRELMKNLTQGDNLTCASPETTDSYSLWDLPCPLPTTTTTTTTTTTVSVTSDTTTAADVTVTPTESSDVEITTNATGSNDTKADIKDEGTPKNLTEASIYSVSGFLVFLVVAALGVELHARRVRERAGDDSLWWQDEDRVNGSAKYKYENIIEDEEREDEEAE